MLFCCLVYFQYILLFRRMPCTGTQDRMIGFSGACTNLYDRAGFSPNKRKIIFQLYFSILKYWNAILKSIIFCPEFYIILPLSSSYLTSAIWNQITNSQFGFNVVWWITRLSGKGQEPSLITQRSAPLISVELLVQNSFRIHQGSTASQTKSNKIEVHSIRIINLNILLFELEGNLPIEQTFGQRQRLIARVATCTGQAQDFLRYLVLQCSSRENSLQIIANPKPKYLLVAIKWD